MENRCFSKPYANKDAQTSSFIYMYKQCNKIIKLDQCRFHFDHCYVMRLIIRLNVYKLLDRYANSNDEALRF